jgi:hypothetical protein
MKKYFCLVVLLLLILHLAIPARAQPPLRQALDDPPNYWNWNKLGGDPCLASIWALWFYTDMPDEAKLLLAEQVLADSVLRKEIRKNWDFYRNSSRVLDNSPVWSIWTTAAVFSDDYDVTAEEIWVDRSDTLILHGITYGADREKPKIKPGLGRCIWKNHSQALARIITAHLESNETDSAGYEWLRTSDYYLYWFYICSNIGYISEEQTILIRGPREEIDTVAVGLISGHVFHDQNKNGSWDKDEPPLPGWQVKMFADSLPTNPTTARATATNTTDSIGFYQFESLSARTYYLAEIVEKDWKQTLPVNPSTITVQLAKGDTVTDRDFGNYQPPPERLIKRRCLHYDTEVHFGFGSVGYYLWDTANLCANWYPCKWSPRWALSVKLGTGRQAGFEPQVGWKDDFSWSDTYTLSKLEIGIRLANRTQSFVTYFYAGKSYYQGAWQKQTNFEWETIWNDISLPLVGEVGVETIVSEFPQLNYSWIRGRLWHNLSQNFLNGRWQAGIEGYDEGDYNLFGQRDFFYQRAGIMLRYQSQWQGAKWDYFLVEWGHGYYGYFAGVEAGFQLIRLTKLHKITLQKAIQKQKGW